MRRTYLYVWCMDNVCSLHGFERKLMIKESNDAGVGENYVRVGFVCFFFRFTIPLYGNTICSIQNRCDSPQSNRPSPLWMFMCSSISRCNKFHTSYWSELYSIAIENRAKHISTTKRKIVNTYLIPYLPTLTDGRMYYI